MSGWSNLDEQIINLNNRILALEQNGIPGVRDFFATSALSVLANLSENMTGNHGYPIPYKIAEFAYEMADCMIEERKKSANP